MCARAHSGLCGQRAAGSAAGCAVLYANHRPPREDVSRRLVRRTWMPGTRPGWLRTACAHTHTHTSDGLICVCRAYTVYTLFSRQYGAVRAEGAAWCRVRCRGRCAVHFAGLFFSSSFSPTFLSLVWPGRLAICTLCSGGGGGGGGANVCASACVYCASRRRRIVRPRWRTLAAAAPQISFFLFFARNPCASGGGRGGTGRDTRHTAAAAAAVAAAPACRRSWGGTRLLLRLCMHAPLDVGELAWDAHAAKSWVAS